LAPEILELPKVSVRNFTNAINTDLQSHQLDLLKAPIYNHWLRVPTGIITFQSQYKAIMTAVNAPDSYVAKNIHITKEEVILWFQTLLYHSLKKYPTNTNGMHLCRAEHTLWLYLCMLKQ
jgi:hypothetical protein